jgi:hypothetical protein
MAYSVTERTSAEYTCTLQDEDSTAVPGSTLTALTLSLIDVATGTVLNSRTAQNVLNANNVTVSELGVLVWALQPADNAIIDSRRATERHQAIFRATWSAGAKAKVWTVDIDVANAATITT